MDKIHTNQLFSVATKIGFGCMIALHNHAIGIEEDDSRKSRFNRIVDVGCRHFNFAIAVLQIAPQTNGEQTGQQDKAKYTEELNIKALKDLMLNLARLGCHCAQRLDTRRRQSTYIWAQINSRLKQGLNFGRRWHFDGINLVGDFIPKGGYPF